METTATTTTNADSGNHNRIDQFKSEVSDLNLKTGSAGRDRGLMILGIVLMVVGIVGSLLAYISSRNLDDARDVQSMIIFGLFFLIVGVTGAALFLRYSLAHFLRMWLLRNLYEGQANTDRLIDAMGRR